MLAQRLDFALAPAAWLSLSRILEASLVDMSVAELQEKADGALGCFGPPRCLMQMSHVQSSQAGLRHSSASPSRRPASPSNARPDGDRAKWREGPLELRPPWHEG